MHYKDGTEAKLRDVVKGTGYNLKDKDGKPAVFVGTVVGLTPGSQSCNIQVAHVVSKNLEASADRAEFYALHEFFSEKGVTGCGGAGGGDRTRVMARVSLEYGQCDAFELVHRPGE